MRSLTYGKTTWHDGTHPTEAELLELQKQYGFHDLDIEDCLSEHERPKVEEYETYLFLVIHVPYLSRKTGRILKEEVNIFVGQNFIVTLHRGNLLTLERLTQKMETVDEFRKECLEFGTGFFLYELMHAFFDGVFPLVDNITRDLRLIEDKLFASEEQIDVLREVMKLKRNIITMRSILMPQRTVIAALEHKNKKFVSDELALYFDDILDAIERQWSLLETAKELSDALQDTHEAWLSHRTNSIVKVLTIFSVIVLPLTFITGLYGMNLPLPFQDHPLSFFGLALVMLVVAGGMLRFFAKRNWL